MTKKTFQIFDPTVSPQVGGVSVGIGDGEGVWLRVKDARSVSKDFFDVVDELIHFVLTGAPSGTTIKLRTANELTSPMVAANAQNPQDAGTMVDVAMTTTGTFNVSLPSGIYFTLIISGSGSPLPAWVATARGQIVAA